MKPVTIPAVNPLVQDVFRGMIEQGMTYEEFSAKSGLGEHCLANWRAGHRPLIDNLQIALETVGLELHVSRKRDI